MEKSNSELIKEMLTAIYAKDKLEKIEKFIAEADDTVKTDDIRKILNGNDELNDLYNIDKTFQK